MGNLAVRGQRAPCRSDRPPDECPASHPNRATDLPGHLHRGPDATTAARHDLHPHHPAIQAARHDRARGPHRRALTSRLPPSLGGGNPGGVQYSRRHCGYFLDGLCRPAPCRISWRNRSIRSASSIPPRRNPPRSWIERSSFPRGNICVRRLRRMPSLPFRRMPSGARRTSIPTWTPSSIISLNSLYWSWISRLR